MKKVLFIALVAVAACTMSSCKKSCTCKEANSGLSKTFESGEMEGLSCSDVEDIFQAEAAGTGQRWSCSE